MMFLDSLSSEIIFDQTFFCNNYHNPDCPKSARNKNTSYLLIAVPEALKQLWNLHKCVVYVVCTWFSQNDFHITVNFFIFYWTLKRPKLCWQRTGYPSNTRRSFSGNMKLSGKGTLSTWVCSWIEGLALALCSSGLEKCP